MDARGSDAVRGWLRDRLSQALGMPAAEFDLKADIAQYGLDSMTAVEVATDLSAWLGQRLEDDLLWAYPSVEDIVGALETQGLCVAVAPKVGTAA